MISKNYNRIGNVQNRLYNIEVLKHHLLKELITEK